MSVISLSLPKNLISSCRRPHAVGASARCWACSVQYRPAMSSSRSEVRAASVCSMCCLAFSSSAFSTFSASRRVRGLRRAVKAMTSELEVVLTVRRARVEVDGHGTSLRV